MVLLPEAQCRCSAAGMSIAGAAHHIFVLLDSMAVASSHWLHSYTGDGRDCDPLESVDNARIGRAVKVVHALMASRDNPCQ